VFVAGFTLRNIVVEVGGRAETGPDELRGCDEVVCVLGEKVMTR
jgi:hypothetical protein